MLGFGRWDEAARILGEVAASCRAIGSRATEGFALHNRGLALARLGDVPGGVRAEEEALAIARQIGQPRLELWCLRYQAVIWLESGRGEAAPLRAGALVALGRVTEARADAMRALELRRAAGSMSEQETELFLAAHDAGIEGALEEGLAVLLRRTSLFRSDELRRSFSRIPPHARLLSLARDRGLATDVPRG